MKLSNKGINRLTLLNSFKHYSDVFKIWRSRGANLTPTPYSILSNLGFTATVSMGVPCTWMFQVSDVLVARTLWPITKNLKMFGTSIWLAKKIDSHRSMITGAPGKVLIIRCWKEIKPCSIKDRPVQSARYYVAFCCYSKSILLPHSLRSVRPHWSIQSLNWLNWLNLRDFTPIFSLVNLGVIKSPEINHGTLWIWRWERLGYFKLES